MPSPKDFQFDLPATDRPSPITLPEEWFPGVQNFWARCTSQRSVGDHINGIVAVVIHATAGASSSGAVSVMNPAPGKPAASFHWLVPDEDEPQHGRIIWACAREKDAAWHVQNSKSHPAVNNGKTHVNHWSLGIEIVNRQSGGDSFSDWQVAATAQIVRYCYAKYPNLKHVISHARLDPQRRNDPGPNFPWDKFQQLVMGHQAPLSTLIAIPKAPTGSPLDQFKTATPADEEANFKIRENIHIRSLHK